MSHTAGRLSHWLDRVIDADERYICGACDIRFPGRIEGISHVEACHPEFARMVTNVVADHDRTPDSEPALALSLGATNPLMPALG